MKKLTCLAGVLALVFLILLLTGNTDEKQANEYLDLGNELYAWGLYEEALTYYELGLVLCPDNEDLSFNAAQAANHLGEYVLALLHYDNAGERRERFLNSGRVSFRIADHDNLDHNMKMRYYEQALQTYKDGILLHPQDLELKFNYEFMLRLMEEEASQEDPEPAYNDQQDPGQNDQDQEEEQDLQEEQNQNSGEQEQDAREENAQDPGGQQEQGDGDQDNSERDQEDGQTQTESGQDPQEDEQAEREAVERLFRMLDGLEEDSLKNNQGVVAGEEGRYAW